MVPLRPLLLGALLAFGASPALAQAPEGTAAPSALSIPSLFAEPPPNAPQTLAPEGALAAASAELQGVAHWISTSRDNAGLPYLLVDKVNAQVYAFDAGGRLLAAAPALLGMTPGDKLKVSNDTQMSQMTANDRITPAGRFVSRLALDSNGKELLVLDYDAAISLHAVVKGTPAEHRAERLASATVEDNRISFGCINVPAAFYSGIVSPTFARTRGIVYVLPETSPAAQFFGFQPAEAAATPAGATALNLPVASPVAAPDNK